MRRDRACLSGVPLSVCPGGQFGGQGPELAGTSVTSLPVGRIQELPRQGLHACWDEASPGLLTALSQVAEQLQPPTPLPHRAGMAGLWSLEALQWGWCCGLQESNNYSQERPAEDSQREDSQGYLTVLSRMGMANAGGAALDTFCPSLEGFGSETCFWEKDQASIGSREVYPQFYTPQDSGCQCNPAIPGLACRFFPTQPVALSHKQES